MSLAFKKVAVGMLTPIGALNDAKLEKLQEVFAARFPLIGRQEGGESTVLVNPNARKSIVIAADRIILEYNGDNVSVGEEDISQISDDLHALSVTLLLNKSFSFAVNLVAHARSAEGNALVASMKALSESNEWNNLSGVGLRLLFEREDIWEYKLEPLLSDRAFYFLEAICNTTTASLHNIKQLIEEAMQFIVAQNNKAIELGYLR